ncbi:MAG: hypothetical protein ACRCZF_00970, partial [Gemmataceae bacterium]
MIPPGEGPQTHFLTPLQKAFAGPFLGPKRRTIGRDRAAEKGQTLLLQPGIRIIRVPGGREVPEAAARFENIQQILTQNAIDPACSTRPGADSSAIVIISSDGQYYRCHATWNAQVTAPDLIRQIEILNQRWNPDCIVYESNGGFAALGQILASIPSIQTRLVQVHQSKTKQARVNALATFVENGTFRIRLPEQTLLYQQMTE